VLGRLCILQCGFCSSPPTGVCKRLAPPQLFPRPKGRGQWIYLGFPQMKRVGRHETTLTTGKEKSRTPQDSKSPRIFNKKKQNPGTGRKTNITKGWRRGGPTKTNLENPGGFPTTKTGDLKTPGGVKKRPVEMLFQALPFGNYHGGGSAKPTPNRGPPGGGSLFAGLKSLPGKVVVGTPTKRSFF